MENNMAIKLAAWAGLALRSWLGSERGGSAEQEGENLTNPPGKANSHHPVETLIPQPASVAGHGVTSLPSAAAKKLQEAMSPC